MATILRGKNKGQQVPIIQWCNDWFMVGDGQIISPTSLQLDPDEMIKVLEHKNNGRMFGWYELKMDGRFKKMTNSTGPR
jgi:hypothetical protein